MDAYAPVAKYYLEWGQEDHQGHHSSNFSERICLNGMVREYVIDFGIIIIHKACELGEKTVQFRNRKNGS